jgi:UDP-3-O-[3-hydroxymyristoyl] N-acetylglucosamine deacetylase
MKNFWEIIPSSLPQTTINKPVSVSGWAFRYSAEKSTINFLPTSNQGLVFKIGKAIVPVNPNNIAFDKNHCTNLQSGKTEIKETEHVLSAVYGLGITNLVIEIIGPNEPPIMDGSAKSFINILLQSGVKKLDKIRQQIIITDKFRFSSPDSDSYIEAQTSDNFELDFTTDFPKPIGIQHLSLVITPESFQNEISFARPPLRCPVSEALETKLKEWFRGYEKNKKSIIYYSKNGYLTKLRAKDEIVRHKILDFIGDLANIGLPVSGKFICYKVGHKINGGFAKLFR